NNIITNNTNSNNNNSNSIIKYNNNTPHRPHPPTRAVTNNNNNTSNNNNKIKIFIESIINLKTLNETLHPSPLITLYGNNSILKTSLYLKVYHNKKKIYKSKVINIRNVFINQLLEVIISNNSNDNTNSNNNSVFDKFEFVVYQKTITIDNNNNINNIDNNINNNNNNINNNNINIINNSVFKNSINNIIRNISIRNYNLNYYVIGVWEFVYNNNINCYNYYNNCYNYNNSGIMELGQFNIINNNNNININNNNNLRLKKELVGVLGNYTGMFIKVDIMF
ncbi:hypothetical protein CDIK_3349, partial [Cucumispora dikerogammari]